MKVTRDKTEECQAFLTIELEEAEVEDSINSSYRHLANEVKIPGFRKGKAPRQVIERYLGRESLLEEALKHLLPEAYGKAIEEQKIEPIAQPEIEMVQTEPSVIFKALIKSGGQVTKMRGCKKVRSPHIEIRFVHIYGRHQRIVLQPL